MGRALRLIAATAAASSLFAGPAFAYIGPGAGLGVAAAFWALLVAVASSLLFLVLWPLRNRLRRRKARDGQPSKEIAHRDLESANARADGGRS